MTTSIIGICCWSCDST